jgi:hypothetical protein
MKILTAVLAIALFASLAPAAGAHPDHSKIDVVRDATERFRDVDVARSAGYKAEGECVESPEGGMGIHYGNERLMSDRRINLRRPEILVYQPVGRRLRLVAVEYYRADADGRLDTDDDRPHLFGRGFDGPMEGHGPGQPVHYDLHAWVWKRNPAGTFDQWNPRVSCPDS